MATITSSENVQSCCRTCLNDASNKMYDIFTETSSSGSIAIMLRHCTSVKVIHETVITTVTKEDIILHKYIISSSQFFGQYSSHLKWEMKPLLKDCQPSCFSKTTYLGPVRKPGRCSKSVKEVPKCVILCSTKKLQSKVPSSYFGFVFKVDKDDDLPQKLCESCYDCLVNFYNFRKLAESIDARLRSQLKEEKYELNDNKFIIKTETDVSVDCDTFNSDSCISDGFVKEEKFTQSQFNEELYCNTCASYFESLPSFREHCETHGEPKDINCDLKCTICSKKFKNLSNLEQHLLKHNSNERYTCEICSKSYKQHFKYIKHLVNHHGKDENELLEINQNNINSSKMVCNVCSAHFRSSNSLSAHMRKHAQKGRILACSVCGKVFQKVSHVKRHELCHDINRPYKCTLCPKSFNTENLLEEHAGKHEGTKPYTCPVCSKAFPHLSTLKTHLKRHTREKTYLCPTCGKRFDSTTNLNQHTRRHLGLKAFACSMCPRKFISKGELKSHLITHTGVRSFSCDQCDATFTKGSSLKLHTQRHSGEKPHQCDTCPMRFTTKQHLKRHYRIHTGEKPHKCDLCERAFTQSNDLVKHKRSHLGDKLYKCDECDESFRLKTQLRHHSSKHFISSQQLELNVNNQTDKVDGKTQGSVLNGRNAVKDSMVTEMTNNLQMLP